MTVSMYLHWRNRNQVLALEEKEPSIKHKLTLVHLVCVCAVHELILECDQACILPN